MNNFLDLSNIYMFLEEHGIDICIFGGWAEELRNLIKPRLHKDIDLLFPSNNFKRIDEIIKDKSLIEIKEKHFPHKRAFIINDIVVELFLVRNIRDKLITKFFGSYEFEWPTNTLKDIIAIHNSNFRVASKESLVLYRNSFSRIDETRNQYNAKFR